MLIFPDDARDERGRERYAPRAGGNMLVLARLKNEVIWIGDDITITVIDLRDNKCRLGIQAPRAIRIDRAEVREARIRAALPRPGEEGGAA
jgi:carbon storage regulator